MTAQVVTGPIEKVPCAHCGDAMDLREFSDHLEPDSSVGGGADRGQLFECDRCHRNSRVVQVRRAILISVRQA